MQNFQELSLLFCVSYSPQPADSHSLLSIFLKCWSVFFCVLMQIMVWSLLSRLKTFFESFNNLLWNFSIRHITRISFNSLWKVARNTFSSTSLAFIFLEISLMACSQTSFIKLTLDNNSFSINRSSNNFCFRKEKMYCTYYIQTFWKHFKKSLWNICGTIHVYRILNLLLY